MNVLSRLRYILNLPFLIALLGLSYTYFFVRSVPRWFNPFWTTDDALQQLYQFHVVKHPELFSGDLVTEVMKGYLAPLHYWLSYLFTYLTGNPIMMGHWLMLLQAHSAMFFLFLAVRAAAGFVPAVFSVVWLLHTRQIMQRMTAGLPRGWAAVILTATLYCIITKRHRLVLVILLAGCLLHPPATLIAALTYGLSLLWGAATKKTRSEYIKPLKILLILSPIYALITLYVVHRPEHVGQMVSYEEASVMPEFQHPKGRFPFVPLTPVKADLKIHGFHAFIDRFYKPAPFWRKHCRTIVVVTLVLLLLIALVLKSELLPRALICNLLAIMAVYFASRELAFRLYVPNRHLQFPLAIFFITGFSIGVWRLGLFFSERLKQRFKRVSLNLIPGLLLLLLGSFIYICSGTGLYGDANFNYWLTKKGKVFVWFRKYTPLKSLVAGHPTFIDGIMLFGERQGFITTETAHPFYKGYNKEVQKRLAVSLKAHFARDLKELYELLAPHNIDYFVFERKRFYPHALKSQHYFPPQDTLVKSITNRHYTEYAYRKLPVEMDLENYPFMPFKDEQAAVVDIAKLKIFLERNAQ